MLMKGHWLLFGVLSCFIQSSTCISAEELILDHVTVTYKGVNKTYAEAIGRTVARARNTAVEQFGFDMPETIQVDVNLDPNEQVRLFNDGSDHIFLTVRSDENLLKPSTSGVFQIYGMCHEVGHIAMYRLIPDHSWMKGEAAEGWAHYMGSRLVDVVYAKEGGDLWPDKYDYLQDGMKRLEKSLAGEKVSGLANAAGAWKKLANIVGEKKIAAIFRAWGKAKIDPADPGVTIEKELVSNTSDQIQPWWSDAQDLILLKREKSKVAAESTDEKKLAGKPRELAHDDGKSAGQNSSAGGGHAVRFDAGNDTNYVTEVRIYGSRYGMPAPPKENFHVWICDKDFKVISDLQFPYSKFQRANPKWVTLKVKPTKVPQEFIVCVGFNPTATKGVYMYYDAEGSGNSLVGLPGEDPADFEKGDWLMRVSVSEKGP